MTRVLLALSFAASTLLMAQGAVSAQANIGTGRIVCPLILSPVCGRRGDETRTFANKCMAERQGFVVIRTGSCDGTPRSQLDLIP